MYLIIIYKIYIYKKKIEIKKNQKNLATAMACFQDDYFLFLSRFRKIVSALLAMNIGTLYRCIYHIRAYAAIRSFPSTSPLRARIARQLFFTAVRSCTGEYGEGYGHRDFVRINLETPDTETVPNAE